MTDETRNDGLWGYDEVAEYLGISPKTVRKWANERRLPLVKIGALNRFRPDDIRAWVADQAQPIEDEDPAPAETGATP